MPWGPVGSVTVVEESVATASLEVEEVLRRLERCLPEHQTPSAERKLIIFYCQTHVRLSREGKYPV